MSQTLITFLIMLIIGVTLGLFTLGNGLFALMDLLSTRSAVRRRF